MIEEKEGKRDGVVTLRVMLSLLLSILTVVSVFLFISLTVFRRSNVESFAKEIDLVRIVEELSLQAEIADYLNDIPHFYPVFSASGINEFIKRDSVADELSGIVDGYMNAFLIGDLDYHVTFEDAVTSMRRLEPDVYGQFGINLTNEDYWILSLTLDDGELFESLSISQIFGEEAIDILYLDYLFSSYLLVALGILCILLILNIVIVNWKSIAGSLLVVGISVSLAGVLLAIAIATAIRLITYIDPSMNLAVSLLEGLTNLLQQRGLYAAVLGAVLILLSITLFIVFKYKDKQTDYISDGKKPKVRLYVGIGANAALAAALIAFLVLLPVEIETKATANAQARADAAAANMSGNAVMHTVTFDANNGSWLAGEVEMRTVSVRDGESVGAWLPHDPVREGYTFRRWLDISFNEFTEQQPIRDDVTVRALWVDESVGHDIEEFLEIVEALTSGLNTTITVVENIDNADYVVHVTNNDPTNKITITLDRELTLSTRSTWKLDDSINLDFINHAVFTIESGMLYENLGMMRFLHMSQLVVNDGAVFANLGSIEFKTIRVNTVHSGGTLINDGSIISIGASLRIAGFVENNGYMNIALNPDLFQVTGFDDARDVYGGHFLIENFEIGDVPELAFVNNGEIVIADDESFFNLKTGIFINNGRIASNGEFHVYGGCELIIGKDGVFENNGVLNNLGTVTIDDGGRLDGNSMISEAHYERPPVSRPTPTIPTP